MAKNSPEIIEQRVRDGEWLTIGLVAKLLSVDPKTVKARTEDGTVRYKDNAMNKYRYCHPADVLALLDASREVHRGGEA